MDDTAAPEEGAKQGGKKRTALIAVLIAIALPALVALAASASALALAAGSKKSEEE